MTGGSRHIWLLGTKVGAMLCFRMCLQAGHFRIGLGTRPCGAALSGSYRTRRRASQDSKDNQLLSQCVDLSQLDGMNEYFIKF